MTPLKTRNTVRLFFLYLFIITALPCRLSADQPRYPLLSSAMESMLSDPVLVHGIQGVRVESLADGSVLYEKNGDLCLLPASNFKLLVASAALESLGPDYRMQTAVYEKGKRAQGVLEGDIFLVGGGDPVLGWEDLRSLAKQVKKAGINRIKGNVVADDTLFDDVRLGIGWSWDNEPYYYSAQISALNLRGNVADVWVRPGIAPGAPARVELIPSIRYLGIENLCKTSAAGSQPVIIVDRLRGRNTVRVRGSVPLDYNPASAEESITVEDPALFACRSFIDILMEEGVTVSGGAVRGEKPKTAGRVALHNSPPLSQMLAMLLKPSNNLIAECLLKNLGANVKKDGSTAAGGQVMLEFMKKIGADMTAIAIADGSGLARTNYISPRNLTLLLRYIYWHPHYKIFLDALPVAGVDGTLKKRMAGTPAENNVRAKTGYVSRVSTISGYVTTKGGEPLVFSIMMNNHLCSNREAVAVQDRILEYLSNLEPASQ